MLSSPLPAVFFVGCALLPWLWLVNIWLFWPAFWDKNGNVVVKRCKWQHLTLSTETCSFIGLPVTRTAADTQWSLAGCSLLTSVLVSWSLTFALGGFQASHVAAATSLFSHKCTLSCITGGPQLLGQERFNKLDVSQLDLESAGLTL